ncbi:MAG: hypothetical protein M3082_08485 [Candidatus Dormibacteraeota bacterium]|nr:hypothetical protein [Candidatus Dormibacteraeota bacterium]
MRRTLQALLACAVLMLLLLPGIAQAANPGSLQGETLTSPPGGSHATINCTTPIAAPNVIVPLIAAFAGTVSYEVLRDPINVATGTYSGTFTETGLLTFDATLQVTLSADFKIYNAAGELIVTGHKLGSGRGICTGGGFEAPLTTVTYTAQTPAGPDSGTSTYYYSSGGLLSEVFTSTAGCDTNGNSNGNDQCNQ